MPHDKLDDEGELYMHNQTCGYVDRLIEMTHSPVQSKESRLLTPAELELEVQGLLS